MRKIKEIFLYREMIKSMVVRDLRGRYKSSFLGFLWTFINPLCQIVIYTVVFSVIMRSGIDKFYLFLIVGLIPWIFFSSSITGGAMAVISQESLVKKIYFPREVLPISYVTSCFVNMLFCFVIIFGVIIFSNVGINFIALVFLPLVMAIEFLLALGIAMISSACTVYFRDLEHILGVITMAWLYLTPIMYSIEMVPESIRPLFMANPMTPIIMAYRDILYYRQIPHMNTLVQSVLVGCGFLIIGMIVFNKLQKNFAEEL